MTKTAAKKIVKMAEDHGFPDSKWMNPKEVITGNWVRMKCQYGCPHYGKGGCCPPEVPAVENCRKFFGEYRTGLFLHFALKFEDPKLRFAWGRETQRRALALEREVFLADFPKAFIFPPVPCRLCRDCPGNKRECRQPFLARPSLEAFAVDVYGTARRVGYSIHVVKNFEEEQNRFGLLLVE